MFFFVWNNFQRRNNAKKAFISQSRTRARRPLYLNFEQEQDVQRAIPQELWTSCALDPNLGSNPRLSVTRPEQSTKVWRRVCRDERDRWQSRAMNGSSRRPTDLLLLFAAVFFCCFLVLSVQSTFFTVTGTLPHLSLSNSSFFPWISNDFLVSNGNYVGIRAKLDVNPEILVLSAFQSRVQQCVVSFFSVGLPTVFDFVSHFELVWT